MWQINCYRSKTFIRPKQRLIKSGAGNSIIYPFEDQPSTNICSKNQDGLNYLIRDLTAKRSFRITDFQVERQKFTKTRKQITFYLTREEDLLPFFSQEHNLLFCLIRGIFTLEESCEEFDESSWIFSKWLVPIYWQRKAKF